MHVGSELATTMFMPKKVADYGEDGTEGLNRNVPP